jgi:AcrR family transcriptional regulator
MARPRAFDLDLAADQALHVFWSKGYEGTTLGDLTAAMGINRPSLYAAFGSKEGVFRKALERYAAGPGAGVAVALQAKTGRDAVQRLLRFYADAAGHAENPKGCLLVNGALACGEESLPIRDALAEQRHLVERSLAERLARAQREGDLRADASPTDLARYVWTVCLGLSVQASSGGTREQARRVAALAMRAWPD